jgi:cold shock CspA family protein
LRSTRTIHLPTQASALPCAPKGSQSKPSPITAEPWISTPTSIGNALRAGGEVKEAIAHYRRALEIDPDYHIAHNNLGLALYEQGELEEAIAHYRRALEIDPNFQTANNNLLNALRDQVKREQAPRVQGRVKWFNTLKGHGFIELQDGTDVFVDFRDIQADGYRTLQVGAMVEFEIVEGPKGLQAVNVVQK